jgi:hypothetical protein
VAPQCQGFAAKKLDRPQTVFGVAEEREPRRAVIAAVGPIALGEYAADDVFVDLDVEHERELLCDSPVAEARARANG